MTPKKPLTEAELAGVRAMVIYEDDSVLVLNKPAGLSSQGARGGVKTSVCGAHRARIGRRKTPL